MKKRNAFLIFMTVVIATVSATLVFIQSKFFARTLKAIYTKYSPLDLGIDGGFSELEIKVFPPGFVLKKPSLVMKKKNPAKLPEGTKIEAEAIDITFQFFQLLTGAVTVNAVTISGANLALNLNEEFFANLDKPQPAKKRSSFKLSWDSLVQFHFRSVSLLDSQLDLKMKVDPEQKPIVVRTFAKELTVGQTTVGKATNYDFAVDLDKAHIEFLNLNQDFSHLQASAEASAQGLNIRNFGVQEEELNVHFNGSIKGNILNPKSLKSSLNYIVKGPINQWILNSAVKKFVNLPKGEVPLGTLTVEGKLNADLLDLQPTLETDAQLNIENFRFKEWDIKKASSKVSWKNPKAEITNTEIYFEDGSIKLSNASYDILAKTQAFKTKVDLDNTDLRKVLGPAVYAVYPLHIHLTGQTDIDVQFRDEKNFEIRGDSVIHATNFELNNQNPKIEKPKKSIIGLTAADVKGSFYADPTGVELEDVQAKLPNSLLKGGGRIDFENGFNLNFEGDVNLKDIGRLLENDVSGEGSLNWQILGKLPELSLIFDTKIKNGRYLNLNLGDAEGRIAWRDHIDTVFFENIQLKQGRSDFSLDGYINAGKNEEINLTARVQKALVPDFAAVFSDFLKKSAPWYPYDLTGQVGGKIRITGETDLKKLMAIADLEVSNLDLKHEVFRSGTFRGGYNKGVYFAENVNLQKKAGFLKGGISFDSDTEKMKFAAHTENFSTQDIDQLAIWDIPYRAPISFRTSGEGKSGAMTSETELNIGTGFVKNYAVYASDLKIKSDPEKLEATTNVFSGRAAASLIWGWTDKIQSSFEAKADKFSLTPAFLVINPDISEDSGLFSEINGSAKLKFRTSELSRLTGTIDLSRFILKDKEYLLELSRPFFLEINQGNYKFDEVSLLGKNSNLTFQGEVQNHEIDYRINGTVDLSLWSLIVNEISQLKGVAKVNAKLYGKAEAPHLQASLAADNVNFRLRSVEQPFEDLKLRGTWNDSNLKFSELGCKFASGTLTGEGQVELYLTKAPDLNFDFYVDNSKVKVYPVVFARTVGKMSVVGEKMPYHVKGNFQISEALVRENFNLNDSAKALRTTRFMPPNSANGKGDSQLFDLDIDLKADRKIFVKNDLFDGELKGNLKVINTIRSPKLLGDINILHGKLFFKDNFFTFQSGTVQFNNPAILDPEFNITANADVKGYKILLVATGKVSDYKLNFESQPPLGQNDIVSLLTLGVTSTGYKGLSRDSRDSYSSNELYGLLFSQSGINKNIQEKFGVKVSVDQSQVLAPDNAFRAKSATDVTDSASPKVVLQKEVSKSLKASAGTTVGVGNMREQSVNLEWSPLKKGKWEGSFIGVYEDQRGALPRNSRNSTGGDVKFRYRFK